MKKKEIKELHQKTREELLKMINDIKSEVNSLNLDLKMKKLKNTNLVKTKKKEVARILTIIKEIKEKEELESEK